MAEAEEPDIGERLDASDRARRRRTRQWAASAVALVLVLAAIGVWSWNRSNEAPYCMPQTEEVADLGKVSLVDGRQIDPTWYALLRNAAVVAREDQAIVAAAVAADSVGYDRVRAAIDDSFRPSADQLHEILLDPDAASSVSDEDIRGGQIYLDVSTMHGCGMQVVGDERSFNGG